MRGYYKVKKSVHISAQDIINFLKEKELYSKDNNINKSISLVSSLNNSHKDSLVWIKYSSYKDIDKLKASVILVNENFTSKSEQKSIIYTKDARLAMALVIQYFFLEKESKEYISHLASIHPSAKIGKNCIINEYVVIAENVSIGDNVVLYPDVTIYPNTTIKDNVVINSGTKIGQEGFGYIRDLEDNLLQFPHIGGVVIENNVEIGSNCTIDKGALQDTLIGCDTKINNLVHIAHNVVIGKGCLIGAKVDISGSVTIEDSVYIAPNAVIIDGIKIGAGATIGIGSIIRKDVQAKSTMVTFEAVDKRTYIKRVKLLKGLEK